MPLADLEKGGIIFPILEKGAKIMNQFWNNVLVWLNMIGAFLWTQVLPIALIAVAGIILIRVIMKAVEKALSKSKMEKAAHTLIKTVCKGVLYGLLCLMLASRMGIDVTGVIALASVLTLAVSLAVQDFLANVVSGFTLICTDPFSSGDFVEIAGQSGTVLEIGMTYTKLATGDNKEVCIPNKAVTSTEIVNYSVRGTRRVDILVSASYDAPVQTVIAALKDAAALCDNAFGEPAPFAAVKEYGDSAIGYVLQVWCDSADYWTVLYSTNENIKKVFDERGIEMTYPHLNVHLDK